MNTIFTFLNQLSQNNNKEWFSAHKEDYETAKKQAEIFFRSVYEEVAKTDFMTTALTTNLNGEPIDDNVF